MFLQKTFSTSVKKSSPIVIPAGLHNNNVAETIKYKHKHLITANEDGRAHHAELQKAKEKVIPDVLGRFITVCLLWGVHVMHQHMCFNGTRLDQLDPSSRISTHGVKGGSVIEVPLDLGW